ncbi:T9SS type A sorting domain-containing protein [Crocinitomix algicola]|uniref:T9SS type A sorting domain-containing protein n=1 Tax=Crocinitomix algicola TaxID=1740263 RepID=UPI000829BE64|nr:T9SS type A sorting domain-containing protein [Crocinitomix algicola]
MNFKGEYNESITIMNGQGDEGFGSGSLTLSSSPGTRGGFVAQLNRDDGKINFIEHVGSALSKNRLTEITINENNGDIYVAGQTYDIESETRVFIRKYKPSLLGLASPHWEQISNPGTKAIINGMDYDGASPTIEDMGSLWFTGTFRESFRFGFDALLTTSAQSDAFVGKFSEYYAGSGDYVVRNFVKKGNVTALPTYEMEGNDIDTDPGTGNAYITGTKTGEIFNVFGMLSEDLPLVGGNTGGYFVAMKHDGDVPTGNLSEITYPATSVYGTGISVAVKNDKVYFTGTRNDDVKFALTEPILPHTGFAGNHLYIVAYDLSTGNYVWANGTQNPSIDVTSHHYPFAITTNHEGHAYIVGNFWSKMGYIDGTPSSGNLTYTSNGGSLFIMRVDIEGDGEKALESTLSDDITEINQEQIQFNRDLRIENSSDIKNNILLYPNPSNGQTFLKMELDNSSHYEIFIHSLDGKLILQQNGVIGTNEFNTTNFETGIYIISLIGENLNHQLTLIKN